MRRRRRDGLGCEKEAILSPVRVSPSVRQWRSKRWRIDGLFHGGTQWSKIVAWINACGKISTEPAAEVRSHYTIETGRRQGGGDPPVANIWRHRAIPVVE